MGGGVSLIENVEELMTTTMLIGRAISAMSFPGMYRLYDFHSKKAPKLRNARQFTFFVPDSDDEEDDNEEAEPDPSEYAHFFKVTVNGDEIYLENPTEANEAGWTPLHTCCMSLATVSAGIALIDETIRRGGDLEVKTIYGPGTFNKGWTALQMASGYGIDALVQKLVEVGANVNAINGFGYSCIHEACHRGFGDVVKFLLESNRVDLRYIPPDELAAGSPFASAPCQSPLAEAARCGFYKIVQQLLDAGAPKNLQNRLGWTALHEACFYHRIETVKTLLLNGADPTIRTARGALPYHLAGLPEIKHMLREMGGESAVPLEDDVIDMIQILTDLTLATELGAQQALAESSSSSQRGQQRRIENGDKKGDDDVGDDEAEQVIVAGSHTMPVIIITGPNGSGTHPHRHHFSSPMAVTSTASSIEYNGTDVNRGSHDLSQDSKISAPVGAGAQRKQEATEMASGGRLLGTLPALSPSKTTPLKSALLSPRVADPKDVTNKKKTKSATLGGADDPVPADMPRDYLCQLTQKPMSDPMKTIYGNVYDKTAIMNWFTQQGRICPLTGLPLAEIDLTPLPELAADIRAWILKRSLAHANDSSRTEDAVEAPSAMGAKETGSGSVTKSTASGGGARTNNLANSQRGNQAATSNEDDLYDF
mmetsp:Transcript_37694/g.27782  ORF Transcript_37694/g.27782 Transcript_37694/m.27782 type:complete len:652 (+) Transcript_37694:152-2107(+)|eukprot:CAMPEP_0202964168 /NCGR_PEP_ID=MMETSP1396-20130829/8240_1 /ASSEMBLY_ACC=CAM_ASM_000872 /TAXON_ID= /ORGANISM="Pseudokeronopsis sp., Strain Brazil" /LENGTH=651 /DNA_ID=CAMNT_0049686057 /DNA_START=147 /DNA_END=2102 /DNA_ORIENTATION=-